MENRARVKRGETLKHKREEPLDEETIAHSNSIANAAYRVLARSVAPNEKCCGDLSDDNGLESDLYISIYLLAFSHFMFVAVVCRCRLLMMTK